MAKLEQFGAQDHDTAVISGKVGFNSLAQKRENTTSKFASKPEYVIELIDPQIETASSQGFGNFLQDAIYTKKATAGEFGGRTALSLTSKGNAPRIFDAKTASDAGLPADQVLVSYDPATNTRRPRTLASGQEVKVAVNVYKNANFPNLGWGIQGVLLPDMQNIQFYQGSAGGGIANFGIQPKTSEPPFQPQHLDAPLAGQSDMDQSQSVPEANNAFGSQGQAPQTQAPQSNAFGQPAPSQPAPNFGGGFGGGQAPQQSPSTGNTGFPDNNAGFGQAPAPEQPAPTVNGNQGFGSADNNPFNQQAPGQAPANPFTEQ